jgi:hypothetical protein
MGFFSKMMGRGKPVPGPAVRLDADELFEILTGNLLTLSLVSIPGVDSTEWLAGRLVEERRLPKDLADRIAAASCKAYAETGDDPATYFPACNRYLRT